MQRALIALAVLVGLLMVVTASQFEWRGGLTTDVDSQMRMAFLEWAGSHGTPRAYLFPRDGAPGGMLLHWTLPYDLMALALAAPAAAIEGWHLALQHAALIAGPLSFVAECAATVALARAAGLGKAAPWALAVVAISPALTGYTGVGRMTHHGITAALGTMALASAISLCRRGRVRDGAWAAAWATLAAWESIELVPALLAAWAVVIAGVSLRRTKDRAFIAYAALLPILALMALLTDPDPKGILAPSVDRFSVYHIILFAVFGMGVSLAIRFRGNGMALSRTARGFVAAAPLLVATLFLGWKLIPPELGSDLIMNVYMHQSELELKPAWGSPDLFVNAMRPGVFIVVLTALGMLRKIRRPQRLCWLLAFLILGFEFWMGVRYARLAPYGAAVGAVLLGATLRRWACLATADRSGRRASAVFAVLAVLAIAALLPGADRSITAIAGGRPDLSGTCVIGPRMAAQIQAALPPDAVVASDLWFSPELLERTTLRTVAGPFHRNVDGIHDVAGLFAGENDGFGHWLAGKRKVSALLACTLPIRANDDIYDDGSLERRLAAGKVPHWLEKVPGVGDGRFGLYLVRSAFPDGAARPKVDGKAGR